MSCRTTMFVPPLCRATMPVNFQVLRIPFSFFFLRFSLQGFTGQKNSHNLTYQTELGQEPQTRPTPMSHLIAILTS